MSRTSEAKEERAKREGARTAGGVFETAEEAVGWKIEEHAMKAVDSANRASDVDGFL